MDDCGCIECACVGADSNVCSKGHICTRICHDCSKWATVPDCMEQDPWFEQMREGIV